MKDGKMGVWAESTQSLSAGNREAVDLFAKQGESRDHHCNLNYLAYLIKFYSMTYKC